MHSRGLLWTVEQCCVTETIGTIEICVSASVSDW